MSFFSKLQEFTAGLQRRNLDCAQRVTIWEMTPSPNPLLQCGGRG